MASDKMVPITAQQPSEDDDDQLNPFSMNDSEIMDLISATHIVPADEKFDADSLFVVVKNILRRSTNIVDNVLQGQEHQENVDEEVSRISFNPLLRTLKQLIHEMACKAPGVEIAHKTTMLILNKLSSYSWDAKAVLILATLALDYEDFLVPHSSHQLIESMEIPKHVPATLKHSDIQKYGKTICELNKIINNMLDVIESVFEAKKLHNLTIEDEHLSRYKLDDVDPVNIYWIIITVIACTTQMFCLKSDEDKTQELYPFAQNISEIHLMRGWSIRIRRLEIEKLKPIRRKMKELLQTPDEIIEVFKALIFAKDDMQPLIDGSTNKMISIDGLKKKRVLLLISGLDISRDDISILKSIYDGIRENGYDQYKIVWIPIVEQWTDGLQKKFEMLRSKMPWYIVQYFSPLAGIKFIKEAWHFENRPIVVVMNSQGDVFNENALSMIKNRGMGAFPFTVSVIRPKKLVRVVPYDAIEEYTFFCGGKDKRWIEQFSEKVNVLAEDPITQEAYIFIELSCVGKSRKQWQFWKQYQAQKKTESDPENQEIQKLLLSFKNESRWAVLTKWSTRVVSDHGTTILKVLEAFEEWKVNVPEKGFEICFKEYHDKFLKTGPQPSTS